MNLNLKIVMVLLAGLFFFLPFSFSKFGNERKATPADSVSRLTLLFSGDVMQHQAQIDAALDPVTGKYNYDSCFIYVRNLVSSFDVAIANLEVTLGGSPYRGYPQFSAPDVIAVALLNAGYDIVGNANNHSCDRGSAGIERTIRILDSIGLRHTGTFKDSTERAQKYPLIINKNGIKVALLNYTYGTNGIVVPSPNIVNMIDTPLIAADLQKARDSAPDKIIVFVHWGEEYRSQPDAFQEQMTKYFFDNGADIIIGSHPHVLERMERYHYPDSSGREVICVYSLGNYISNQRDPGRDGGASFALELKKSGGMTEVGLAGYFLNWVWIDESSGHKKFCILPASQYENSPLITDSNSIKKMKSFLDDSRKLMRGENKNIPEIIFDWNKSTWAINRTGL